MTAAALPAEEDEIPYRLMGIGRLTLYHQPGAYCWSHVTVESAAEAPTAPTFTCSMPTVVWSLNCTMYNSSGPPARSCNGSANVGSTNVYTKSHWRSAPLGTREPMPRVAAQRAAGLADLSQIRVV